MRRGHNLEINLGRVIAYLNEVGIHAHKNHAHRTADGTYLDGEPFDYEVMSNPPHVFDAKEAAGTVWSLTNAKPTQVKHLLNCAGHGAEAYFLVLFEGQHLRRFDAEYVRSALAAGRKSLTKEEGREWHWQDLLHSKRFQKS